jgi:hypothetical protein
MRLHASYQPRQQQDCHFHAAMRYSDRAQTMQELLLSAMLLSSG